jgi:multidrug efflux pump subunit AcrB
VKLTEFALEKRAVSYFLTALLLVGGVVSFLQLGQLEDPDFTVKTAMVITRYPGASPLEVELEVTDRIEKAIQEMPALDEMYSESRAGLSLITVDIKQEYWADRLPLVWNELRNKVGDVEPMLPPGAETPQVMDDFSFVYGFVLAVTGDGYSEAELDDYVDALRKDLSVVPGVARAEVWGTPAKVVYVDVSRAQLAGLGLTPLSVSATLRQQNMVVDAGGIDLGRVRARIAPAGTFTSVEEIGDLVIRGSMLEDLTTAARSAGALNLSASDLADVTRASGDTGTLIRIRDIATVSQGTYEPRPWEMRFNGDHAIGLSLANVAGGNIVETGRALDARLAELVRDLPIGIEVRKIAWQSALVTEAIDGFMVNLLQAILIVLVVLTIPMGWRMGLVIGSALVLTILGTFIAMALFGVDLQRMSLGALVIALGMMVDNAIVVSDGIYTRLKRGMDPAKAAIQTTSGAAWPLLGATIVAVMAFYPIFASVADAGEYCRTLFTVVAVSLLLSWLLAMTLTPLQCIDLLKVEQQGEEDPYGSGFYLRFRGWLASALRARLVFMGVMLGLLVASVWGFQWTEQMFFPDAARAQLMVDYWAPASTRIQQVSQDLRPIEKRLMESEHVTSVSSFIGQGPPRFYLPVNPEAPNASYAQIIVNTHDWQGVDALIEELEPWLHENVPQAMVRIRKYGVGPADTWKFEARIHGPAEADLATLRRLSGKAVDILRDEPLATDVRIDMRERVPKVVPRYDQELGRWANITREDLAASSKRVFDGFPSGLYREGRDLHPILVRNVAPERERAAADLEALQVAGSLSTETVPLSSVIRELGFEWEDPVIARYNRRRTVSVQATPVGVTFPTLRAAVIDQFNAIELPPGFEIFWAGEYDSTVDAQASLTPGIIPTAVLIITIIVMLFNAYRPPLIILLTIPFVMIGITVGLLVTRAPFGFVALLGAMSLAGMMIKNAIVLLDEIEVQLKAGSTAWEAILDAAVSRLRPVVLAAATTVLGVIPLLQDPFWYSMAVTIMAGLAFGTLLTMVVVPVLYSILYRVQSPETGGTAAEA